MTKVLPEPLDDARTPTSPRLRVCLLGGLELRDADEQAGAALRRAPGLLLAVLAMAPDRAHPREVLIEQLWPGVDAAPGRNRLRNALFELRERLTAEGAGDALVADRQSIRLRPGALACDVTAFEQAVRHGDTERAQALYRGELLPGHYDDWVQTERLRLAALHDRLATAPAAAPRAAPVHGLPRFLTRSFGADARTAALRDRVLQHRLVTAHGPGGCGKTRLAADVAAALMQGPRPAFERAVFVALIDCVDVGPTLDALCAGCGLEGSGPPLRRLAAALASGRTLLVLDNLEQLSAAAVDAVAQLLHDLPALHVLATSRRLLGVSGEQAFEVTGLPVPAPQDGPDARRTSPAVALFVDRAQALRAGFRPDEAQLDAIAAVTRLLGGLPLALELAATRMRSLSPAELLLRLRQDAGTPLLDTLARNGRDGADGRHASMRQVVSWSWRQLNPPQKDLMAVMALFGSPARLDTVAAVAADDALSVAALLGQLDDQSLLRTTIDANRATRYALLQPVREFVLEQADPLWLGRRRERLRQWLLDFGRQARERRDASLAEVQAELPLLLAVVDGCVSEGAADTAAQLVVTLRRHWELDARTGLPASTLHRLLGVRAQIGDARLHCELCLLAAYSQVMAGASESAATLAEAALSLAPDDRLRGQALMRQAQAGIGTDRATAELRTAIESALALARSSGDAETEGLALRIQMIIVTNRDEDYVRGEQLSQQAQRIWERLGHVRNANTSLMDRASTWLDLGRYDDAATALQTCEVSARADGHATGYILSSWQRGRAELRRRQPQAALAAFQRCVRDAWAHHRLAYVADALVLAAGGLAACGHLDDSARLLGFAVPHWTSQSGPFYRSLAREVTWNRRVLRLALGPVRLEALRVEGLALRLPAAVALALGKTDVAPSLPGEPA